ncbi:MAG: hypothetical protein U0412_04645 [Nitrospira sp.]
MPVNMDPNKKRRKVEAEVAVAPTQPAEDVRPPVTSFGEETASDREKELADAEWKNLWDATEVIDADTV